MDQKLISYVKDEMARGVGESDIRRELFKQGWSAELIEEAFKLLKHEDAAATSSVSENQVNATPSIPVSAGLMKEGTLFREAFRIYRDRIWVLLGLQALQYVIGGFGAAALILGGGLAFVTLIASPSSVLVILLALALAVIAVIIVLGIVYLASAAQLGILYAVRDRKEYLGIGAAYKKGLKNVLSLWWIGGLSALTIIAGLLLLIVPGVIFSIWYAFGTVVLVGENMRGRDALIRSHAYVRGRWGAVFIRFLLLGLIYIAFAIIVSVFEAIHQALGSLVSVIGNFFLGAFSYVFIYTLYEDLVRAGATPSANEPRERRLLIVLPLLVVIVTIVLAVIAIRFIPSFDWPDFPANIR